MAREVKFREGFVYRSFFFNVGTSIDLEGVAKALSLDVVERALDAGRAQPQNLSFFKAPLVTKINVSGLLFSGFSCDEVEIVFYDLGVIVISLKIPFNGGFSRLISFHKELYESERANKWAQEWFDDNFQKLEPLIILPNLKVPSFKYSAFFTDNWNAPCEKSMVEETFPDELARLLRATDIVLSEEEVDEALAHRVSFSDDDFTIIDFDAAFFAGGPHAEGWQILETMLVQHLKLRWIGEALNPLIDLGISYLRRPASFFPVSPVSHQELTNLDPFAGVITEMMMRVDNMMEISGGRYLERLHHVIAEKMKFEELDEILNSKLEYLGEMYQHLHDERAIISSEKLEWMIVILILISLLTSFFL